jgi:hypothetical protein
MTEKVENLTLNSEKWMESLKNYIDNLKLYEIMIPGTHDSGCYNAVSLIGKSWIVTQHQTIEQQLKLGARYFDLRFSYFEGRSTDEFWISHNVWNTKVSYNQIETAINNFLDSNTKEVVIIKLSHFRNFNDAAHNKFIVKLTNQNKLGKYLVPRNEGSEASIATLWQQNKRLIVISVHDQNNPLLWPVSYLRSRWCNTLCINSLKIASEAFLNQDSGSTLNVLELILTPTEKFLISNFLTSGVNKLAEKVNPIIKDWLQKEWFEKVNIYMIDFYNSLDWVYIAVKANIYRSVKKLPSLINEQEIIVDCPQEMKNECTAIIEKINDQQRLKINDFTDRRTDVFLQTKYKLQNNAETQLVRDGSAKQVLEKILDDICQLNRKVGLFGGEITILKGQNLFIPKTANKMINFYNTSGGKNCNPEQVINQCIKIAKKVVTRSRGTFLNKRQEETQNFYRWVSTISKTQPGDNNTMGIPGNVSAGTAVKSSF